MASARSSPSVRGSAALVCLCLFVFVALVTVVYVVGTASREPPPAVSLDVESVEHPRPNRVELVVRHRAGETLHAENVAFVVATTDHRLRWVGDDARRDHALAAGEAVAVTLTRRDATVQWGTNESQSATWTRPTTGAAFAPDGGATLTARVVHRPSNTSVSTVETTVPRRHAQTTNSTG
jgi:hypothetical protein